MITFAQIKGAIGLTAVLTIVFLSWGIKHQTDKLVEARAERDAARAAAQQNADAAKAVQDQRDRDISSLRTLQDNLNRQRDLAAQAVEQLEELKRNEAMVQADPHGVRDRINSRMHSLFIDLSCASGRDDPDCSGAAAASRGTQPAGHPGASPGAEHEGRSP